MPSYQTFLSGNRLGDLFTNIRWLLFFVAPIVMIWFAIKAIGLLILTIRKIFDSGDRNRRRDDDDDYDVYHY
ncbi:hypothetical protein KH400_03060 [Desertibacillus haloalkaliphilus]|nr:hypothetical protein [Desertibacillus haloalkaliphilus]